MLQLVIQPELNTIITFRLNSHASFITIVVDIFADQFLWTFVKIKGISKPRIQNNSNVVFLNANNVNQIMRFKVRSDYVVCGKLYAQSISLPDSQT